MLETKSKTVSAVGYDSNKKIMRVKFYSGAMYEYLDIHFEDYKSVIRSESIGSTLRKVVKDKLYKKI